MVAVVPLASILLEVIRNGISTISFQFITALPGVPGQTVGGIGPAIQGTLLLIALTSVMGIPPGVLTGIYLAEFGNNKFGRTIRFLNDVLTEFPSIVIGILAFSVVVIAIGHFSAIAG